MAKAKPARTPQRTAKARRSQPTNWKKWAGIGGALFAVAVIVYLAQSASGSSVSADTADLARQNAGSDVRVLQGSHHTVYHSDEPLPTSAQPRADGKASLVWFSGTWCERCEQMESYAHSTAAEFQRDILFIEKSVDHDESAANRYGVRGTPTFVLIDASGRELTRFSYLNNESEFRTTITKALKGAGIVA